MNNRAENVALSLDKGAPEKTNAGLPESLESLRCSGCDFVNFNLNSKNSISETLINNHEPILTRQKLSSDSRSGMRCLQTNCNEGRRFN